jgi:hypothetical protein
MSGWVVRRTFWINCLDVRTATETTGCIGRWLEGVTLIVCNLIEATLHHAKSAVKQVEIREVQYSISLRSTPRGSSVGWFLPPKSKVIKPNVMAYHRRQ